MTIAIVILFLVFSLAYVYAWNDNKRWAHVHPNLPVYIHHRLKQKAGLHCLLLVVCILWAIFSGYATLTVFAIAMHISADDTLYWAVYPFITAPAIGTTAYLGGLLGHNVSQFKKYK